MTCGDDLLPLLGQVDVLLVRHREPGAAVAAGALADVNVSHAAHRGCVPGTEGVTVPGTSRYIGARGVLRSPLAPTTLAPTL